MGTNSSRPKTRFRVLPEHADRWPQIVEEFTAATRGEPGCRWFDWSRSLSPHLARTPRIVNATVPRDDGAVLGELAVPEG